MIVAFTPTRDSVTAGFAGDMVKLCRRREDLNWCVLLGIYIADLRHKAVCVAQQLKATHLLFLDSDMRFPADTLDRLLAADKDIVGANCVMRTLPGMWNARTDGKSVSSVGRTGLQEVQSVGAGVLLINLDVFDRLSAPYFQTPYSHAQQAMVGEDIDFCFRARVAGFSVWIDHDLSQRVTHQGAIEWGVQNVQEFAIA